VLHSLLVLKLRTPYKVQVTFHQIVFISISTQQDVEYYYPSKIVSLFQEYWQGVLQFSSYLTSPRLNSRFIEQFNQDLFHFVYFSFIIVIIVLNRY
jgi:hypothetical protein